MVTQVASVVLGDDRDGVAKSPKLATMVTSFGRRCAAKKQMSFDAGLGQCDAHEQTGSNGQGAQPNGS
jgi:hypothetical protein